MRVVKNPVDTLHHVRSTVTFDGTTGGGEAGTAVTALTVTGRVLIESLTIFCSADLTESGATATLTCGIASDIAKFLDSTQSVAIDVGEWWASSTPKTAGVNLVQQTTSPVDAAQQHIAISESIIYDPLVTNTTGGTLIMDVWYRPITDNGALA